MDIEKLAKALKVSTEFTDEDRKEIKRLRETGFYSLFSAKDKILEDRVLIRISELVEKVEGSENRWLSFVDITFICSTLVY